MLTITELELEMASLPVDYGKKAHEAEVARYKYELELEKLKNKEAGDTLKLQVVKVEGESQTKMGERIKNQVVSDLHNDTLEVLKLKSDWKKLEIDAEVLDKKIMLLCKKTDMWQTQEYQTGRLDKAQKPVFTTPIKSAMGRD